MENDRQRQEWNARAIRDAGFAALICGLPSNVLLLSQGYWPVVGSSLALADTKGSLALIVPEDESDMARQSGGGAVHTFQPASREDLRVEEDVVWRTVAKAASTLGITAGRVGCEMGAGDEPVSYASMHRFKLSLSGTVSRAMPGCTIVDAGDMLAKLRAVCTPSEVDHVRRACRAAEAAFAAAARELKPGVTEIFAACHARLPLYFDAAGRDQQHFAIMSGVRSASAFGAYAISSDRALKRGELALVHCNSNIGGYWTDITRTFCLGTPSEEQRRMFDAVAAARTAALAAIRPGARAADVDHAARRVLTDRGFGEEFKHPTGHGVGFSAINHNALPRLHPKSPDVLEVGMVFNVEPAIYVQGHQGMRHCDVVTVTASGAEVLTPFMAATESLILG